MKKKEKKRREGKKKKKEKGKQYLVVLSHSMCLSKTIKIKTQTAVQLPRYCLMTGSLH